MNFATALRTLAPGQQLEEAPPPQVGAIVF